MAEDRYTGTLMVNIKLPGLPRLGVGIAFNATQVGVIGTSDASPGTLVIRGVELYNLVLGVLDLNEDKVPAETIALWKSLSSGLESAGLTISYGAQQGLIADQNGAAVEVYAGAGLWGGSFGEGIPLGTPWGNFDGGGYGGAVSFGPQLGASAGVTVTGAVAVIGEGSLVGDAAAWVWDKLGELMNSGIAGGLPTSVYELPTITVTAGLDGSSTIDEADMDGSHSWSQRATIVDAQGKVLNVTTNNDNGTRRDVFYDPKDMEVWDSQAISYDPLGNVISSNLVNDDGAMELTAFDAQNNQIWASRTQLFDAAGRQTHSNLLLDTGGREESTFDVGNNQTWSRFVETYNASDQHLADDWYHDSGWRSHNVFDVSSNQTWSWYGELYNPNGQNTETWWFHDSGWRSLNVFDVASNQAWTWYGEQYNPSGQHTETTWLQDNGWRNRDVFDVGNNQTWSRLVETYNASDQHVEDNWYHDSGWRSHNVFDVSSNQTWTWYGEQYNPSGQNTETTWFHDTGWRSRNVFDVNSDQSWSWYGEQYDPSGRLVQRQEFRDDGGTTTTTWDVGNMRGWSSYTDVNGPNGEWSRQGSNDNGTTFRTGRGRGPTLESWTYSATGQALYRDFYTPTDSGGQLLHQSFTTGQLSLINGIDQTLATFNAGSFVSFTAVPVLPYGSTPTLETPIPLNGPTVTIVDVIFVRSY